jgi:hypothetical protein
MAWFIILFRYKAFRYISIFAAAFLLSGCLGGSVATQIIRSIATSAADKAVARAMDVDEDQPFSNRDPYKIAEPQNNTPQGSILLGTAPQATATKSANLQTAKPTATEIDDYTYALATFSFAPAKPIAETIPETTEPVEERITITQGNQLVRVELFNLLIGEEKNAVYEKARLMGSTTLPQKREWQNWNVGTGAIKIAGQIDKKMITFLIPPEFGKLPSGSVTFVELAGPGELNIARYKVNDKTPVIKALANR